MPITAETAPPVAVAPNTVTPTQGRVMSVDALRGFDMFWIIGADALVQALNKFANGNSFIAGLARQVDHVDWEGFHFYDLIFPLFVFIVGVSIVFSLGKRVGAGSKAAITEQVIRRAIVLYLLGIFTYEGIARGFENIRLLGVLQRIALCYLFASLAFLYLKPRHRVVLCVALLVGYWGLMTFVPVPGVGAGNFAEGSNLANFIDQEYLPLRKWDGNHDPEGLLSTLPAIASCLLGLFAGTLLQRTDVSERKKVLWLLGWGVAGVVMGFLWSLQFPVIKKIWTSSFVLVAGGFSAILLASFYQIIDVWGWRRWAIPFVWIGTNAITIYVVAHLVRLEKLSERIVGGEIKLAFDQLEGAGDLVIALVALGLAVLFCRFLYQRKIFIKV